MKKHLYFVAVDGSEWSERAADKAVSLANKTGAKVCLFCVMNWSGFQPVGMGEAINRPLEKVEEERITKEEILDPLMKKYSDSSVDVSCDYTWGHPVEVIHQEVKDRHAEMVFAGRRGRSRVADLMLGSVSNSLAHAIGVPLVLVP